ncbi:hypothetical protein ACFZDG_11350 [Kitasatospora xanthocidica]|uniref:hypothetical protein n=1 Tax=Kitasatospora xanthocidica TaxID=83382 RepID=UPI0036F17957
MPTDEPRDERPGERPDGPADERPDGRSDGPADELAELRARLGAVEAQEARLAEQLAAARPVGRFVHRWKAALGWTAVAGVALAFVLWSYPTVLVTLCLALALVGVLAVLAVLELLDEPGRPARSG